MRTYELTASMALTAAVPDEFIKNMREASIAPDASAFLKAAEEAHPQDDDEFILMILRNGLKRHIRDSVIELLKGSGIGGTFSPVLLKRGIEEQPHVKAALASEVAVAIPA